MSDLEKMFAQARQVEPSPALRARILADALAVQARQRPAPAPKRLAGWLSRLSALLSGSGGALAGGALAGFAGLALGLLQPSGLDMIGEVLASESASAQIDLMPGFAALTSEE